VIVALGAFYIFTFTLTKGDMISSDYRGTVLGFNDKISNVDNVSVNTANSVQKVEMRQSGASSERIFTNIELKNNEVNP
jgi:hypothetical protein